MKYQTCSAISQLRVVVQIHLLWAAHKPTMDKPFRAQYDLTHQLNDDTLNQLAEGDVFVLPVVVQVLDELGDDLGVCVGLKDEALGLQERLDVLVVGDDAIVDHKELWNDKTRAFTIDSRYKPGNRSLITKF